MDKKNINKDFSNDDKKFMRTALRLASRAAGMTSPNPMVGAVIVRDGKIISSGYHKKAGLAHAEVEAINLCRERELLKGAKMYVTLEPCSFYGKTPPCTKAIIESKIKEVIIAVKDPNPKVSGNGIAELQKNGINTRTGLYEKHAKLLNEIFFKHISKRMPFLTAKIAASIDGKTAAGNGHSKWITGVQSRKMVQKLRYEHDCVLTGINTIVADNPLLYPRDILTEKPKMLCGKRFYRVILDSGLKISKYSRIVQTAATVNTIIFTSETNKKTTAFKGKIKFLENQGIIIKTAPAGLDLEYILKSLYDDYTITSVMLEAGRNLLTSFLKNNLIDKYFIFMAPKIIGGSGSYGMFSELNIKNVNHTYRLNIYDVKKTGDDLLITAYPEGHKL
ncbi:MAG: bifunctional diaminohydroxyphosphoribosylaminopyrimidine deaminase/5-amino-6-(5-phosphoribosylamino)uracil reductase RibD [Actinobacteria bacterium]|nr:bifunctional diaminohydroxyphosphoribosylaminopyrimidine deaminase/5-amino-6-(5-phosphoribosylamino)uracil reductase RibD [Actinomycetota bacterium]